MIPFKDPQGCYLEIRTLIECEAQDLSLKLEKRRSNLNRSSGRAQFAKSPRIKKIYKSLVRRASRNTQMAIEQEDPTEDFVMVQHDATITSIAMQTPL